MGMCQKRCPKCKKKRRFVDVHNPATWTKDAIDPLKDQTKHDAGWRYVEGERICGYCAWRMKDVPDCNSTESQKGFLSATLPLPTCSQTPKLS